MQHNTLIIIDLIIVWGKALVGLVENNNFDFTSSPPPQKQIHSHSPWMSFKCALQQQLTRPTLPHFTCANVKFTDQYKMSHSVFVPSVSSSHTCGTLLNFRFPNKTRLNNEILLNIATQHYILLSLSSLLLLFCSSFRKTRNIPPIDKKNKISSLTIYSNGWGVIITVLWRFVWMLANMSQIDDDGQGKAHPRRPRRVIRKSLLLNWISGPQNESGREWGLTFPQVQV